MKQKILALALALALALMGGCALTGEQAATPAPTPTPTPTPTPEPTPTPPPEPTVASMVVCGDVMVHSPMLGDAWHDGAGKYDFTHMMAAAASRVEAADYALANLETTLAGGPNYSGYPCFHTPDELAYNLKDLGFDLVLTANNHCMDTGIRGLYRTLDVLDEVGLAHVGTSRTEEEARDNIPVADVGGISVAFLGYTYGTNGIPVPSDADYAVNRFNTDYLTSLSTPDTERILADLARAKEKEADLICVLIHWGNEYQTKENWYQDEMADLLIANGADLILGGHSHVLQPIEMRTVATEDGGERTGFVSYSLGNFISGQLDDITKTTAVLTLELTRDNVTGEAGVTGWDYAPMFMLRRDSDSQAFQLIDAEAALDHGDLSDAERTKVETAVQTCREILDPEEE